MLTSSSSNSISRKSGFSCVNAMGFTFPYAVEAIVFFACACSFSVTTLQNEYIYQVVSEELNYTANNSVNYCAPHQNTSANDTLVAGEVSKWTMYASLSLYIPCAVCAFLLTAWSDKIGRKRAIAFPVIGTIIQAAFQVTIIAYRLPLYWLVINVFVYGCFGAASALLNIGTAYLSDTVKKENRGRRFTILGVSASFGGGMIQIATGYWINAGGFVPPSFFVLGCAIVALLFVSLLSPEKKCGDEIPDSDTERSSLLLPDEEYSRDNDICRCSLKESIPQNEVPKSFKKTSFLGQLKVVWKIYSSEPRACQQCNQKRVRRRIWRLWFFVFSFSIYMFAVNGGKLFRTMFFVSHPVCFTPDLVGAQAGMDDGIIIFTPFVIIFCQTCFHLSGQSFIVLGIVTRIISCLMMSFARGPLQIFIATSLGVVYNFTTPFMRSETAALVSASEQGSSLAMVSGMESLVNIFSPIVFMWLYPETLSVYHGLTWAIMALILCVPLVLMMCISIANTSKCVRKTNCGRSSERE